MNKYQIVHIRFLLILYTIALAIVYSLSSGISEWYAFYDYLNTHGIIPYIDYREGYPPLGFLLYLPLYYLSGQNPVIFTYGFRALNGALLVATIYLLYLIIKTVKGERRALLTSLVFTLLPSVVIANTYSNDIIALFFSSLGIYYMLKKRPSMAGLMIGLGTLSKGFPLLLLLPAILYFDEWKERYKLVSAAFFTIFILSLPFLISDAFTYYSTFVHHGTRGPWETIWALIDGWYSHGGFFHPAFDQFFYHSDLLRMYSLTPYDHVFYQWQYPLLPSFLTLAQIGFIVLSVFIFKGKKQYLLQFIGFTYFSYMFFFKGYSTQFSVSTPFYALLSLTNYMLPFMLILESSQLLQILSWNGQSLFGELIIDQHQILLVSAIIIRTGIFLAILYQTSRDALSLIKFKKPSLEIIRAKIPFFSTLRKAWRPVILATLCIILLVILAINLQYALKSNEMEIETGNVELSLEEPAYLSLGGLKKHDRVMLKLETRTNVMIEAINSQESEILEREIANWPSFRGYFDDARYFLMADNDLNYTLELSMLHPSIPFLITDGLGSDLDVKMSEITGDDVPMLNITIKDRGMDGKQTLFRLAYPVDEVVDEDFETRLNLRLDNGNVSSIFFDVLDVKDDWLYSFRVLSRMEGDGDWMIFTLDKDSQDIFGYRNLFGDDISQLAIAISIDDGEEATLTIGSFEIQSNKGSTRIPLHAYDNEEIKYTIYKESKYSPEIQHLAIWFVLIPAIIAFDWEFKKFLKKAP